MVAPVAADAAVATSAGRGSGAAGIIWHVVFGSAIVLSIAWIAPFFFQPGHLFIDAHIYFGATSTWLAGGNPWTYGYSGIPFAGIPPTLLLNLPLIPFGEPFAVTFWVSANTLSIAFLIRRFRLPMWTLALLPVVEGWLGASPDLTLAALIVAGGGWIAALTKPYSAPVLVADRRWRQIVAAVLVGIATIPFLPWITFFESRDTVVRTFADHAQNPVSATGLPVLMVATAIALASLGWRRGWTLFTPALLAQQPHYLLFSIQAVRWSRVLALAMTIPFAHTMAVGVIAYAIVARRSRV